MKYKMRKGIVLTSICDENLLIASTEAREYCPYITDINETAAFIIQRLIKGKTAEEIDEELSLEYEMTDQNESVTEGLIKQLYEAGYMICEGE